MRGQRTPRNFKRIFSPSPRLESSNRMTTMKEMKNSTAKKKPKKVNKVNMNEEAKRAFSPRIQVQKKVKK